MLNTSMDNTNICCTVRTIWILEFGYLTKCKQIWICTIKYQLFSFYTRNQNRNWLGKLKVYLKKNNSLLGMSQTHN